MNEIFQEVKTKANLDYAVTEGTCCNTCTLEELATAYGEESLGIYLRYFPHGANHSPWNKQRIFYIAHDLKEEQKSIVRIILEKYFTVEWDGSDSKSITITLKEDFK